MTKPKATQERYEKGHGNGHINKAIFPALKSQLEKSGYDVTVIKESKGLVYFKFLAKSEELK